MTLVVRLLTIAGANGHEIAQLDFQGWKAHPVMVRSVQTNSYDCGIWVLAGIWAVLRGFEVTSHTEASISRVRFSLLVAILALPTA